MRENVYPPFMVLLIVVLVMSLAMPACSPRNRGYADGAADIPAADPDPGISLEDEVDFAYGTSRTWDDESNVARVGARRTLEDLGYSVGFRGRWLEHPESGFRFRPKLLDYETLDDGRVQTVSVIQSVHQTLVPDGVFEYQHSTGDTLEDSIQEGYERWAQMDLVVLLDALREEPEECTILKMSFPAKEDAPALQRRMVLGPVEHMAAKVSSQVDSEGSDEGDQDEHEPFCSCCFLMQNFEAFDLLVESDEFCGIRFYAMRDSNGEAMADCRVNGEDYEEGAASLRKYVQKWPGRGFEARKQYVVLQSVEASDDASPEETQTEQSGPAAPDDDASKTEDEEGPQ